MIIQNETYRAVGGMDERFFMNSEEVDLQRRLRDLDVPRVFAGDLSVEHIGGASSGDVSRRRQWVLDSRFIYSSKWNENKHLAVALKFATYFNYIFNKLRELRNHEVRATATKDFELELIKNAERKS